ncbi:Por secretion system C-terminal sorting domain-containing protein [Pustulibacterium marinum]|uniref:Por secretion system C-terminal sorting domain-containing protein n=1 Tax=Pustulibacterium marinum TaxID=1224947 RepID=A0A1I7H501_9FLAO|nr:endonuclease [Pustulibacterium marinum]SFU55788.1 Por secretion system C-terminal sorting domain-containing protein [Pustulibacterium marinum]
MQKKLSLILLLFSTILFSQAPADYYDTAEGLTGYALKTELSTIITEGHTAQTYGDLWNAYYASDIDTYYEDDNTILDIYSEDPDGVDPYNFATGTNQCGNYSSEGDCYNREHLFPKSYFDDAYPMYTDIHHIYPTDGKVNGQRGNYPFGEVTSANWTSLNGSKRGNNTYSFTGAYTGIVFEPIDEFKGDIARVYFYMATRYENDIASWETNTTQSDIILNGTSDQVYEDWFLNMLLEWNAADPVSQKEIDRNDEAYDFQGNRNPYIDHPEYITQIWGSVNADTEAPTTPTNLTAANGAAFQIQLSWDASTDDTGVTSYDIYMDDVYYATTSEITFTTASLAAETQYCFTITAKDEAGNESGESNEACIITPENSGGSGSSDLFISEYIEGSGTNKALEIANFTGTNVDLSIYTLKLSSNGNSSWNYTYSFPDNTSITNGNVFVVANSGISGCTDAVDDTNGSITGFNGNDAIGLFKNDVLIDIIGTLGDGSDFAENLTLVRNSDISSPNTVYTISEWTSYEQNTCFLGSHTLDAMNTINIELQQLAIYPNPIKDHKIYFQNPADISINNAVIFSLEGKKLMKFSGIQTDFIELGNLNTGVYFILLETSMGNVTKKFILQ